MKCIIFLLFASIGSVYAVYSTGWTLFFALNTFVVFNILSQTQWLESSEKHARNAVFVAAAIAVSTAALMLFFLYVLALIVIVLYYLYDWFMYWNSMVKPIFIYGKDEDDCTTITQRADYAEWCLRICQNMMYATLLLNESEHGRAVYKKSYTKDGKEYNKAQPYNIVVRILRNDFEHWGAYQQRVEETIIQHQQLNLQYHQLVDEGSGAILDLYYNQDLKPKTIFQTFL
jgi:hypothetical protein